MERMTVWVGSVIAPHEVNDQSKVDVIAASMRESGWQGRPLLVVVYGDGWRALTGTHRLAGAKAAGIDQVPVLAIVDSDLTAEQWETDDPTTFGGDDYDRADMLAGLGLDEAAVLMREEIAANEAQAARG